MERRLRLRESSDIKRVRGHGVAVAEGPFVARVLPNRLDPPQNRYTVVAGKKQGNAVKRNRVKRLAREALRHLDPLLVSGVDVLILVRGKAEEVPDYATARALLDRIVARAGLLAQPASAGDAAHGTTGRAGDRARARGNANPASVRRGNERASGEAPRSHDDAVGGRDRARPSVGEGAGPSPTTTGDRSPSDDAPARRGGAR